MGFSSRQVAVMLLAFVVIEDTQPQASSCSLAVSAVELKTTSTIGLSEANMALNRSKMLIKLRYKLRNLLPQYYLLLCLLLPHLWGELLFRSL